MDAYEEVEPSESSESAGLALCVPNSSPSNHSCFWILGVRVAGSGLMSLSRRAEPTRRGGTGGSFGWRGRCSLEREEMRRGKGGGEGRGAGMSCGEGMRGGGQRDMGRAG